MGLVGLSAVGEGGWEGVDDAGVCFCFARVVGWFGMGER